MVDPSPVVSPTRPTILREELADAIRRQRVLAIVGAGVSIDASAGDACASWRGFLEDGVARCIALHPNLQPNWEQGIRQLLDDGRYLEAADEVARHLGGPGHGEFRTWLASTVGRISVTRRDCVEALAELDIPLATTNYDDVIEDVTGYRSITWRATQSELRDWVIGRDAVLHLHGHWDDPASVVLTTDSYAAVMRSQRLRAALRSLAFQYSFVLIGFGSGVADPHFQSIRTWIKTHYRGSGYRHYRIVPQAEEAAAGAVHSDADDRIAVLGFPRDLASYLRHLDASNVGVTFADRVDVVPATPDDITSICELDRDVFSTEDLIAASTFAAWQEKAGNVFWRASKATRAPYLCGYYAILFLRPHALQRFVAGEVSEAELEAERDLLAPEEAMQAEEAYLFSVVVTGGPGTRLQILNNLVDRLLFYVREGRLARVYATAASKAGRLLLDRLVAEGIAAFLQAPEERADRHPLYRIELSSEAIGRLRGLLSSVDRT